jgi:hypothetical protein
MVRIVFRTITVQNLPIITVFKGRELKETYNFMSVLFYGFNSNQSFNNESLIKISCRIRRQISQKVSDFRRRSMRPGDKLTPCV